MISYIIKTECNTKVELKDSKVHELKGELRKLRLAKKVVDSLIVHTNGEEGGRDEQVS